MVIVARNRYMATCRASLDKSGRAGVQKIHLMQPLVAHDTDVGSSETRDDSRVGHEVASWQKLPLSAGLELERP